MEPRSPPAMLASDVRGESVSIEGKGQGKGINRSIQELSTLWALYLGLLERRPLLTKSLSSGVICGTGNLIEQALSAHAFSWKHWTAFTLVGPVFTGPALHFWHNFLDRLGNSKAVSSRLPGRWGKVLVQIAVDQSMGASFLNSGYFAVHTVFLAALTGSVFPISELGSDIVEKVTSRYWVMIVSNARLWPWVGLLNFGFVPVKLRVLVCNFTAVFWDYLMSKWCR